MNQVCIQQSYDRSCGAASLLCAACELLVTHTPPMPSNPALAQKVPLRPNATCETLIYTITSGVTTGNPGNAANIAGNAQGYSMPDKVAFAARLLGLDVSIYMENNFRTKALKTLYSGTVLNCRGAGIPIIEQPLRSLQYNERALSVLTSWGVALHYVLRRPDNSYMDPGDGQNYQTFDTMNTPWSKMYSEVGLHIVLKRSKQSLALDMQQLFS